MNEYDDINEYVNNLNDRTKQMEKLLYLCAALFFVACSSSTEGQDLFIENYSKQLIEKYPNFESNEIAKNAITDSVTNFCESYVGKQAMAPTYDWSCGSLLWKFVVPALASTRGQ